LCSYLEQVLSGLNIRFHVVFYDTELLASTPEFQLGGGTGGTCGLESQVEECLRAMAKAGRGSFHHFRVSGNCEGDELAKMVAQVDTALGYSNIARKLLEDYIQFCKRVWLFNMHFLIFLFSNNRSYDYCNYVVIIRMLLHQQVRQMSKFVVSLLSLLIQDRLLLL